MILQPIFPLAVVIVLTVLLVGFGVWRIVVSKDQLSRIRWGRRALLGLLVGLMAIGPSVPGGLSPAGMLNLDVMFVVDTTVSMGGEDYDGKKQRLEGVRQDILKLSDKMVGARFAIITFDKTARVLLPMTSDRSSLQTIASSIVREPSTYSRGSSIDRPMDVMLEQFEANKKQNPQRPNLVFYMGDGEQTVPDEVKSFGPLASYVSGGAVLGYGTEKGGPMKRYYGFGDDNSCSDSTSSLGCYIRDYSSMDTIDENAITKIDPQNLSKIAAELGVAYVNRNNGGDIAQALNDSKAEQVADSSRQVTFYTNLYFILAIPFAVLVIWEALYLLSKFRELRPVKPGGKHA